jgi:hypothetical protein
MKPRRPGTFAHLRAKLPGSLPARCFISHGFRDQEGLARLQARLPWYVEPRIFPEVAEAPDSTISEQLVGAILDCPGLIYIASEESLSRPYVSFERDYAVRAGRKLYRFENGDFVRERRAPLNLHAFASYHRADREKVRVIQEFMERRHFGVLKDTGDIIDREEDWLGSVKGNIRKTLDAGGHFVYFVSNSTLRSGMDAFELNEAAQYRPGAILAALLEPAALHDLPEAIKGRAVKLYREDGDVADLDWRKVDRLIVQIYHLVHNEPAR